MDLLKNNAATPIKRLGLSRKRRSSCLNNASVCSPHNVKTSSETEVKKQNILPIPKSSENSKVGEDCDNKSENESELDSSISHAQTKYIEKIKELENLYSVWANGFKNALSYLIELLEKRSGESVSVKELLMQMRLWELVSDHFKNDSDLCCYLSDNED